MQRLRENDMGNLKRGVIQSECNVQNRKRDKDMMQRLDLKKSMKQ